jgi:hypothetical protein
MAAFTALGVALGASASTAFAAGTAVTALGATLVGTGVQMYGQRQQAKTAERVAERNAKIQENQALQTEMDARENARRQRADSKAKLKTQRSRYAKAGVIMEGSPLEVMAETAGLLELDALEIGRQAKGEATRLRAGAEVSRQDGYDQANALRIASGATLLSGAGSALSMGMQFSKAGSFKKAMPKQPTTPQTWSS